MMFLESNIGTGTWIFVAIALVAAGLIVGLVFLIRHMMHKQKEAKYDSEKIEKTLRAAEASSRRSEQIQREYERQNQMNEIDKE